MKKLFLTAAAMAMAAATGARAATVVFDFSSHTGDLGTTETYTVSGQSLTLTAFGTNSAHLYGKNQGGDENGVGMTNDPSGEHEIYYNKGFIQIDVTGLTGDTFQLAFGSTTQGEQWTIFGSNTAGLLGSSILSGGSDGSNTATLATYKYYDVESTSAAGGRNILLKSLTATPGVTTFGVPEPATWAMMLTGFGGVGGMLRRRRTQFAAATA